MKEKLSFPEQFMGSVLNVQTYRYFFRQSMGRALLYLFLASIILAGLGSIPFLVDFNRETNQLISTIYRELPDFELRNGELNVEMEMPYISTESTDFIFAVDTTGELDPEVLEGYKTGVLLTRHDAYHKQSLFEVRHYDLGAFAELTITEKDVLRWIPLLKWMPVFVLFFGFIFFLGSKLLGALVVSIGGLLIESVTNRKVGFENLYKLSIYTLTLPMILQMVLKLVQVTIPLFPVLYYILALLYLYKAVLLVGTPPAEAPDGSAQ